MDEFKGNLIWISNLEIESGTFESMSHLKQLWLNDNNLSQMPDKLPPVLQRLLMRSNKIRVLSASEFSAPRLQALYLSDNRISEIRDFAVGPGTTLPRLKVVDVSGNRLTAVDSLVFSRSTGGVQAPNRAAEHLSSSLESLFLSRNPLQVLRMNCFSGLVPNLKALHLSYVSGNVRIESPQEMALELGALSYLNLKSSPYLASFLLMQKTFWTNLRSLEELDLSDIEFEFVGPYLVSSIPSLHLLKVSSSNWYCNSSVLWLRVWNNALTKAMEAANQSEADNPHLQDNYCFNPSYLRGRNLLSLSLKDFYELDLRADMFVVLGKEIDSNLRKALENKARKNSIQDFGQDSNQDSRRVSNMNSADYFFQEEDDGHGQQETRSSKLPETNSGPKKSENMPIKDQGGAVSETFSKRKALKLKILFEKDLFKD